MAFNNSISNFLTTCDVTVTERKHTELETKQSGAGPGSVAHMTVTSAVSFTL